MIANQRNEIVRRCSFCGYEDHYVNNCNNIELLRFKKSCFGNRLVCDLYANSKDKFKDWLIKKRFEQPRTLISFASRFCKVPKRINFPDRIEQIANYVYNYPLDRTRQIVNPGNDEIINVIITDRPFLAGLDFNERIDYVEEIISFISTTNHVPAPQKLQISTVLLSSQPLPSEAPQLVDCAICYEEQSACECMRLNCNHSFCGNCVIEICKKNTKPEITCSFCREPVKTITLCREELEAQLKQFIV